MKRLLALCLLLLARPVHADGVLVVIDSVETGALTGKAIKNVGPLFDLMQRSLKPGMKFTVTSAQGNINAAGVWENPYTATELTDGIFATAAGPRLDYSLIVYVGGNGGNNFLVNPNSLRMWPRLSLAANRPKVPVMYIADATSTSNSTSGDDSLGAGALINVAGSSPFVTSNAGIAFPAQVGFVKKAAGVAGDYVTPVLWMAFTGYTKADPDGVNGTSPTARDSLAAWFYNPPIVSTRAGTANTAGYGVINWEANGATGGGSSRPSAALAAVAVSMMAKLAPTLWKFPAVNVALEIDDGCKYFTTTALNYPQHADAIAGFDSLGVWGIPYTLGIEVDSMATDETNGMTRFQNEFQGARKYGKGRFTVHCHRGLLAAQGGVITDTTLASAAGHIHADIFGVNAARWSLVGRNATQADQSTLAQLTDATKQLIDYAGDGKLVSSSVMAPTDTYKTILMSNVTPTFCGFASTYDSIGYACVLAAANYKGFPGYKVMRTQYLANQYNINVPGNTGGIPRGFAYPLPSARAIGLALASPVRAQLSSLLYVPSQYLWGTTTDTVSADNYASMRKSVNVLLASSFGFNRYTDATTAAEDAVAGTSNLAPTGSAKATIWVTHLANWRNGIGATTVTYGGGRPAWETTRQVNGAMEAARNIAVGAGFKDGPVKWIYSDQMSEKDIR